MVQISPKWMNIVEWSQHFHRGKVLPEIAMLAQENSMVTDVPFTQCNDGTTHLYSMDTALPDVFLTALGEGTPESKSQSAQERETCTMLSGMSTIPEQTSLIGGAQGAMRAKEDRKFLEAMKQKFGRYWLYGNRALNQKEPWGLLTRYASLSGVKAPNVLNCAGATVNGQCSALLVNWGREAGVYGVFPEGTTAGYQKKDRGQRMKTLPNGNELSVLQTEHLWWFGIVVEAWQSVVRICNVDTANAKALTGNQAPTSFLTVLDKMVEAQLRLRLPGKPVWYVNDVLFGLMMRLGGKLSGSVLSVQDATQQFGKVKAKELNIYGVPVRRMDQMLQTEPIVA